VHDLQSREEHLEGGQILCGRLVQHLRDATSFDILGVNQPDREQAFDLTRPARRLTHPTQRPAG
jgi:hypothetical protein